MKSIEPANVEDIRQLDRIEDVTHVMDSIEALRVYAQRARLNLEEEREDKRWTY